MSYHSNSGLRVGRELHHASRVGTPPDTDFNSIQFNSIQFNSTQFNSIKIDPGDPPHYYRGDTLSRRSNSNNGYVRVRLPKRKNNEIFAIADQLLGASRIKAICADGKSRLARIPGKMKRRMWIRTGDLIIIKPWDFQDEKCDVKWRYTKTQAQYLSRKRMLPETVDVF